MIIQVYHTSIKETLRKLLADDTISFLGTGADNKVQSINDLILSSFGCFDVKQCRTHVEVDHLAAKVFKSLNLNKCGSAKMVGLDLKSLSSNARDLNN